MCSLTPDWPHLCCSCLQNVLLGRDGRAKVSDVGLAKLLGEEEPQQQQGRRGGSQPASKPQGGFVGTFTWAGKHGLHWDKTTGLDC